MFKNILVVSDNSYLLGKFIDLINSPEYNVFNFDFVISPFSQIEAFVDLHNSIRIVDLRKSDYIDQIVEKYDLVFSIHCKQLFPPKLVNSVKCINVHPGYNPINRGWYPQVFAIINNRCIGATIHEIDEYLDHGDIIAREMVEQTMSDTSLSLYNKVVEKEIELLKKNLLKILHGTYTKTPPEKEGFVYTKKDFNALCHINLDMQTTVADVINRLRALTHGDYKNAYFIDPATNEKFFISIQIEKAKV